MSYFDLPDEPEDFGPVDENAMDERDVVQDDHDGDAHKWEEA